MTIIQIKQAIMVYAAFDAFHGFYIVLLYYLRLVWQAAMVARHVAITGVPGWVDGCCYTLNNRALVLYDIFTVLNERRRPVAPRPMPGTVPDVFTCNREHQGPNHNGSRR